MICLSPVRRLFMVGVLVAALAAGACTDKKEPLGPTATLAQPTSTTDPYAVPPVIDEAYVNRVLAGLDKAVGDVVRLVVSSKSITNEAVDRLTALYLGDALTLKLQGLQNDALRQFAGYQPEPGNKATHVAELVSAKPACIFAKVERDFSKVSTNPRAELSVQWVVLVPLDRSKDPMSYNSMQWMFAYDGFREDLSAPPNPCVG
jgi:hypothetical protein